MIRPVVVDVETTIFQKGNPFAQRNRLCYAGIYSGVDGPHLWQIDNNGDNPYGETCRTINDELAKFDLFVAFNAKFDLHWLRRYGISTKHMAVWDLQLVDFILTGQDNPFPSLDDTCARVGLGGKSGDIAERYWDSGVDTPDIPELEMRAYLENDCKIEWELYQWQLKFLKDKPKLKRLCWNACQDVKITAEMEWNGLLFDLEESKAIGDRYLEEINKITAELDGLVTTPIPNWGSGDWVSAVLYGGTVFVDGIQEYEYTYKDGHTAIKTRKTKQPITFPRLVEPLKGTELKKDGFFKCDEGTLKRLHAVGIAKRIISLILRRNKIEKKVGTYFHGIPKLYEEMDWTNNIIHGQLNHARAKTGRLSSSKPNQQNFDPELLKCIKSRFKRNENNISTSC